MNKPVWNTFTRDPYNMMGESVMHGRDSLYRNRAIEGCRVGNDYSSYVTVARWICPVYVRPQA